MVVSFTSLIQLEPPLRRPVISGTRFSNGGLDDLDRQSGSKSRMVSCSVYFCLRIDEASSTSMISSRSSKDLNLEDHSTKTVGERASLELILRTICSQGAGSSLLAYHPIDRRPLIDLPLLL